MWSDLYSSNLVNITKKRALDKFQARLPIGLIISWLTNWKRGSFIVFTFHKFQVETSWRGPWRIEHEKSKILIGQKMSALTLTTHPYLDIT